MFRLQNYNEKEFCLSRSTLKKPKQAKAHEGVFPRTKGAPDVFARGYLHNVIYLAIFPTSSQEECPRSNVWFVNICRANIASVNTSRGAARRK